MFDGDFYKGRKVFITGHTGFKGSWMCELLLMCGASVTGFSFDVPTEPSLFEMLDLKDRMRSIYGDVRKLAELEDAMLEAKPEIVIHMAAQPIVRESYRDPVRTYETNVMGTVNLLEAVRKCPSVRSVINVTTDKVYLNQEWDWGYRENEELNGFDPYSNSKSCSELVTSCYKNSFFGGESGVTADGRKIAISTCRAGNVIGGGDFAADRIIPDCMRAVMEGKEIVIRNPYSTRPYQHVLEPVTAYLTLAAKQYENGTLSGSYNIGPDESDCYTTGKIVSVFCDKWNKRVEGTNLQPAVWVSKHDGGPHEARFLKLDCSRIKNALGWHPVWNLDKSLDKTVDFIYEYLSDGDILKTVREQIEEYSLR